MRDPTPRRGPGWPSTRATSILGFPFIAIAVFAAVLARFFAEAADLPAKPPRAPTTVKRPSIPKIEPPQNAISSEASTNQQVLTQLVFRNRSHQVALTKALRLLEDDRTAEGLTLLQQVLEQPHDSFLWSEDHAALLSTQRTAQQILGSLPPPLLEMYERLFGPEAERRLADAHQSGSPVEFAAVARRFYHTSSGFEAVDWQATRWLDVGRYDLAHRSWARLFSDPVHQRRVTDSIRVKAMLAERLAMSSSPAAPHNATDDGDVEPVRTAAAGGFSIDDEDFSARGEVKTASAEWNVAFRVNKGSTHSESQAGSPPYLRPLWSVDLADGTNHVVATPLAQWEEEQIRNQRSVAVSNFPILAGGLVVLRDFDGIRAVDHATGETAWRYAGTTSLSQAAADLEELEQSQNNGSGRTNVLNVLFHAHAGNAALGTLTSDGRRVFAIDALDIRPRQAGRPRNTHAAAKARNDSETEEAQEHVSRESNRLIALEIQQEAPNPDRRVKAAWTVGGPVGAPNWFYRMDHNDDGQVTADEFTGRAGLFQKIDADSDGVLRSSEADAYSSGGDSEKTLAGHFFLGPPLPVDGRLFVMTELDRQLNLIALKAETGEFLWSQGIGFVDHPVDEDPFRYTLSCTPVYSDGVVLCPTQMGVLAAVDATDGLLLWAYYYGDDDASGPFGNWSYAVRRSFGHTGFPSEPVIHGGRIVYLPRQSDQVHCLDLASGRLLWKIPRAGAEYVALVTDDLALTVGQRYCRGLSLARGREIWSTRLGMPSGSGVQVGDRYLVPLQAGRVATLDIRTGDEVGWSMPQMKAEIVAQRNSSPEDAPTSETVETESANPSATDERPPGNLIVSGDVILSADARRLVALPQAAPYLEQVRRELSDKGPNASRMILAAELESTLGHLSAAKALLFRSLRLPLTAGERTHAEYLIREVLYRQLQTGEEDGAAALAELEPFLRTPADRSRFLMLKAEFQLRRNDFDGVIETAREFAGLRLSGTLPVVGDPTYFVSPQSWTLDIVGKVREQIDDVTLDKLEARVDAEQTAALQSNKTSDLEAFLALYARWPQAARVRNALARSLIDRGDLQRGELQLLESRRVGDSAAAGEASDLLAELWDRAGLLEEAANLWLENSHRPVPAPVQLVNYAENPDAPLPRLGISPGYFSARPTGSPTGMFAAAIERAREPAIRVNRVRISQDLWFRCDSRLDEVFGQSGPSSITSSSSSYQLCNKGNGGNGDLSIIDRLTGLVVSNIDMTGPPVGFNRVDSTQVGHFIPLGSGTAMNGLSLLEKNRSRPAWVIVPPGLGPDVESISPGPSGPTFCVFQARRHLVVADPSSGRILWQRTDIDPSCGLEADKYRGIIGDENVLVVFGSDRASYTLYRTMTGEELRRGKLDVSLGQRPNERHAFGRVFFHFANSGDNEHVAKRMRLWDPLLDQFLLDVPVPQGTLSCDSSSGELVVLLPPNRLLILEGSTGLVRADLTLDANDVDATKRISMISDHDRYYVNLYSQTSRGGSEESPAESFEDSHHRLFVNDLALSRIDVQGTLLAVDRETGRIQWTGHSPQRTILRLPQVRLPFLIALSNLDDRTDSSRKSLLIEIIDAATGEVLGSKGNAMRGRILHFTYDHERRCVELHGQNSVITLDFSDDAQAIPGEPPVL